MTTLWGGGVGARRINKESRIVPVNARYDGCNQKSCAGGSGGVREDPPG